MSTLAKLSRPKVHRALPRERLFRRLDEARELPLVWVTAPAGAGKTMLAASYIDDRKLRSVWYHVDSGDADIGSFFYYLGQTVARARGKNAAPLPALAPEHLADLPSYSRHYFRLYFARLPAPAVLVLDNYHDLPADAALHGVLDVAASELPDGVNIVVLSRAGPPRTLVRLKLGERLSLIDWSQLRLSLEETRAIAARRVAVDEATVRRIYRLTDGWAAGIALSLQHVQRQEKTTAGEHETHEELFDYFATQVLRAATPEVRRFVTLTALLPAMTAEMADRFVAGNGASEAMLEELYRSGAFIDRRSTRPPTYRYHDLFRTFLLAQLEQSVPPQQFVDLQRQAAELLNETGYRDHAIRLYLELGEWLPASQVIGAEAFAMMLQGRGSTLREWIDALPTAVIAQNPWLDFWYGATLTRLAPTEARPRLERVYETFRVCADSAAQRLVCAEIIISFMHEFANLVPMDRWADELQQLLAASPPFPDPTMELQVRTACLFALGFRRPEPGAVADCVARVDALLDQPVPKELAAMASGILVMHLYITANNAAYPRIKARFRALLDSAELSGLSRSLGCMQLGHAALRFNDCAEAEQLFARAQDIGRTDAVPLPTLYVFCNLGLAMCALERGDLAKAETHRRELESYWVPSRKIDGVATSRIQLWIACHHGQWDSAVSLARRQLTTTQECGVFMLIFEAHVLLSVVCAEKQLWDEAQQALQPVRGLLRGTDYAHFEYLVDLAESYTALLRGDLQECHRKLRTGLDGSRQEVALFLLRMQPRILPRLLAEALALGIEVDYVGQLIRTLSLRAPSIATPNWPWPLRIRTLGGFEVLRAGQPLEFSRKAPKKTLALLKAIIAFGGRNVREQLLLDTFWSDEEGDVATRSLSAALHRLRGLLGDSEAVLQQGGTLALDPARVWVDVWAFDELTARGNAEVADQLLNLYRGGFLAEDEGEPWTVTTRERLRGKYIHALAAHARTLESASQFELAIEHYLRGLDADPVIEPFYQGLMRCYTQLDRRTEAISAYRRLKQMLSVSLSLKPSAGTEKLFQSLRLDQALR